MVKCTFKKLGKYKMNKEVEPSLPETKACEGLGQRRPVLLCGMFWIECLMLCGNVPALRLPYCSVRRLVALLRRLLGGTDASGHELRFWKPKPVSFLFPLLSLLSCTLSFLLPLLCLL